MGYTGITDSRAMYIKYYQTSMSPRRFREQAKMLYHKMNTAYAKYVLIELIK
jgi:hypothetical protein